MVGVIGLEYVGLPLAMELVDAGYNVVGIDTNKQKVSQLNEGKSYILDVIEAQVRRAVQMQRFKTTDNFEVISSLDVVVICVPILLNDNQEPDTSELQKVVSNTLSLMLQPILISLESTSYPGTTRKIFVEVFGNAGKK